ncbi:hypothetical protein GF380_05835 [Candidatus Uhrbacteria bacterium]|nr:hypothetical protein [Candidatus Uhrbacteria bacterium]MBD3284511.1 hypothetical protein [Candidatus Uhrbacteria bacterium]
MKNQTDMTKYAETHDMEFQAKCRKKHAGPIKGCYVHPQKEWYAYELPESNHGWPILLTMRFALENFFTE